MLFTSVPLAPQVMLTICHWHFYRMARQLVINVVPSTLRKILSCTGVWCSTLYHQHMAGHDNLVAAHTPCAATLCWQGLGVAERCLVNSGSIIWTSGLCVPPHCRHACGSSLVSHHAALPRKGDRGMQSKAYSLDHMVHCIFLCMSHYHAEKVRVSFGTDQQSSHNVACTIKSKSELWHRTAVTLHSLSISCVDGMHTVQSIVLPKNISLLCLSNYRITFPRCQVRENVTPSSICILSRVCAIARAVCMLTTMCATACRQPLQPSSLSWDPTMLRTIATCFKPCGPTGTWPTLLLQTPTKEGLCGSRSEFIIQTYHGFWAFVRVLITTRVSCNPTSYCSTASSTNLVCQLIKFRRRRATKNMVLLYPLGSSTLRLFFFSVVLLSTW